MKIKEIKVKDIMRRDVICAKPNTPMREVVKIITEKDISSLPIIDEEDNLIGIISEKDLMLKKEWFEKFWMYDSFGMKNSMNSMVKILSNIVGNVMTKKVITVDEEECICETAKLMVEMRKNQLPVVKGRKIVGIITRKDIVALVAEETNVS